MRNLIRASIAALSLIAVPVISQAGLFIGVSVGLPPPALPVYVQPPCPAPGYMWMPGYWAWDEGYYWVPGTWVLAPEPGLLWTPGYWGWSEGAYLWHAGYWGPHVGFYGGINYGFGYTGVGYEGGYWHGRDFYYNRSVTNINTINVTNVYNRTVVNNVNVTRVSFNGGSGGVSARPTSAQLSAEHERHLGATPVQRQQEQLAHGDNGLRASVNGGHPPIAATPRAGTFAGHGVMAARGAEHGAAPLGAAHMSEGAPAEHRPSAAPTPQYAPHSGEHAGANGAAGPQYPPQHAQPHYPQPQMSAQPPRPAPQPATHGGPQSYGGQQGHGAPQGYGGQQGHGAPQGYGGQPPHGGQQPRGGEQPHGAQPGHGGQQAARPEHGGEHNRQG